VTGTAVFTSATPAAAHVAIAIDAAATKTTPIDADSVPLVDSADSNILKRVTWANIKTALQSVFSALYVLKAGDTMTGTLNLPSNGLAVGTDQLVVSGGNVGIGTDNPEAKLQVVSNATSELNFKNTGDGIVFVRVGSNRPLPNVTLSNIEARWNDNRTSQIRFYSGDNITLKNEGYIGFLTVKNGALIERVRFDIDGRVGVNELSPTAQLQTKTTLASRIAQIIQLAASQTADALQVQSSTGAVLMRIEATGVTRTGGRRQRARLTAISTTALVTDEIIVTTATATITLPTATGTGQTYRIVCRAGITTIDGAGADTVKGSLTQTLSANEDLIITDTATGIWE
jgi:hypothetical protein